MKLKILSWNIWERCFFDELKDFLRKSNADIMCLQEILVDDKSRDVVSFLKTIGYDGAFFLNAEFQDGDKKIEIYNGVFSKYPTLESSIIPLSEKKDRGATKVVLKVGEKKLQVVSVHLKHTHQQLSDFQNSQANILIDALPANNVIVAGDFNALPDSYPVNKFSEKMIGTDNHFYPTFTLYPYCPGCKERGVEIKLDYIFVSQNFKFGDFEVGQSRASDHLPICATIEI